MLRTSIFRLLVTLLASSLLVPFLSTAPGHAESNDIAAVSYNPNRLIVQYKPGVVGAAAAASIEGAAVVQALDGIRTQVVQVPPEHLTDAYARLQSDPTVASVTYDAVIQPASSPNDPYLVGGTQWAPPKVQAEAAWDLVTGVGAVIAIVDTGVDPNHPDLRDRLVPGYNFYDGSTDTSDGCGHGTHVAGIAAATGNNGVGIAGIAYSARIMPVKVMNNYCSGSYSYLISGIMYAADRGARVIVVTSGAIVENSSLRDAIVYARARGAIVVTAAGNNNSDYPFYPASYSEAFAVAGTDQNDGRYINSNYGQQIDVSAPASNIYSTFWSSSAGSTYVYMGGTSMAAPHVAGVAALLVSSNPGLTVDQLEQLIRSNADDIGSPGWDPYFGAGRVNALRAVTASGAVAAPPTPIPPTATPTSLPPTPSPTPLPPTATPTALPPTPTLLPPTPTLLPPTATATATAVPAKPTATPTKTPVPTATPNTRVATMHLDDTDVKYTRYWRYWRATADVEVVTAQGAPVRNAKVYAAWSGVYVAGALCTTDGRGRCSVNSDIINYSAGALTFTITNIVHTSYAYDPRANTAETQVTGITPQSVATIPLAAQAQDGSVTLQWPAPPIADVQGFVVYRGTGSDPDGAQRITEQVMAAQGAGDAQYSYVDNTVPPGPVHTYWLVAVENGEETSLLGSTTASVAPWSGNTVYLPMLDAR